MFDKKWHQWFNYLRVKNHHRKSLKNQKMSKWKSVVNVVEQISTNSSSENDEYSTTPSKNCVNFSNKNLLTDWLKHISAPDLTTVPVGARVREAEANPNKLPSDISDIFIRLTNRSKKFVSFSTLRIKLGLDKWCDWWKIWMEGCTFASTSEDWLE